MEALYKLKDFLINEIEECVRTDQMSAQELDTLYKIVDIIKDIYKIEVMSMEKDEGYSQNYRHGYNIMPVDYDMTYENRTGNKTYRTEYDGNSYRRGRDTKTGRYVSMDAGMSRDDEKEQMISKLEEMMDEAGTDKERSTILHCIEKLKD